MEIAAEGDQEFACNAIFDRIANPPRGRDGGHDGAPGQIGLISGAALRPKGLQVIPQGDRLLLELPGGGMGEPATRDPARVARDVRDQLVTPEAARDVYKVALGADGTADQDATAALRGGINKGRQS